MSENEYFLSLSTVGLDNSALVILDLGKHFEMVSPLTSLKIFTRRELKGKLLEDYFRSRDGRVRYGMVLNPVLGCPYNQCPWHPIPRGV